MVHSEKILTRMVGIYPNYGSSNLVKFSNALGDAIDSGNDAIAQVGDQHALDPAEQWGLDMLGADMKTPRLVEVP